MSLVCPDEPKSIVNKLQMSSTEPSIIKGTWTLNESTISITLQKRILKKSLNKYSRKQGNQSKDSNIDQDQTFKIELSLKSENWKLCNQLQWSKYEIDIFYKNVNKITSTKLDLNKVDFPMFYFSRVKSYSKVCNGPLV